MASTAIPEQISLRVVVDKEQNRALYAEAEKDFVDILLSFLTLPLGTIARLVSKDSNTKPCRFGCIISLYESLENLDPKYLNSETCKQMLLRPRNSMERHNQKLKLNIDDTETTKFYACEMSLCRKGSYLSPTTVSTFNNVKCRCGRNLTHVLNETISGDYTGEGYVREASFVVYDDLNVLPVNLTTTLCLLKSLRTKDNIEDFTFYISPKEVMDLLKCSLVSNTVLTDSLLRRKQIIENPKATFKISGIHGSEDRRMKLNIMIAKSKCKVLFAIIDEDFMEQLLTFLAIPLGAVERVFEGSSGLGCIDKLYHSLATFDSTDFVSGKNMFADLKLAPQYNLNKQMLPISEVMYPSSLYLRYCNSDDRSSTCYLTVDNTCYKSSETPVTVTLRERDDRSSTCYLTVRNTYYNSSETPVPVNLWDPKCPSTGKSSYGYVKRPTMFVVADDLSAKPFSSGVVLSLLKESEASEDDLEERTICVGVQEVVNILKAALISTSALTIGLGQFLTITPAKEEK